MAVQKTQSEFFEKMGKALQGAHEKHKMDDTGPSGFAELPGGIDNGIAQLIECKFSKYKTGTHVGEWFFYAAGVCITPKKITVTHEDGSRETIITEKGRTSILEAMCDTPESNGRRKTLDDHVAYVYEQLRGLGVITANLELKDLENTALDLQNSKPYFSFRTWKGKKATEGLYKDVEPRVNHTWLGQCEYDEDENAGAGVEDNSPPSGNGHATLNTNMSASPGGFTEIANEQDLDAMAQQAQDGDTDVQEQLKEMATELGVWKQVDNADDWIKGVEVIKKAKQKGMKSLTDETPDDINPQVNQTYRYKPVGKKGVRAKKSEECNVIKVDRKARRVDLESLENAGQKFTNVSWDDLEGE